MVRTKQGGSILGYVIIAIALVAVLVGSVWVIKRYDFSSKASSGDTTEVAVGGAEDKKSEDKKPTVGSEASDKAKDDKSKDNKGEASTDDKPSTATPPEVTVEQSRDDEAESSTQNQSQVAELPQTGPTDWMSGVSAGLFAGALAAYIASRRYVTGL